MLACNNIYHAISPSSIYRISSSVIHKTKKSKTLSQFVNLNELNTNQLRTYNQAIANAFPKIISESPIIKKYWQKLETLFPEYQHFLISSDNELVGFMNTIPFQFNEALEKLPEDGWDWMFKRGISGFENNKPANYLGGLQVIVRNEYQKLGYSKQIINYCKQFVASSKLSKFLIPIRPTQKHLYPKISMGEYIKIKNGNEIFDPWVRTHLKGGAEIIKICERSMTMKGNINFWERILDIKILKSGEYILDGALRPITIDLRNDYGEYIEPNIWIKYN